jgi:CDP-4-dehydro-6-deoxyglucose reductase
MNETVKWFDVGSRDDFGDEEVFGAMAGNMPVAVYEVDGEIYATHDICTHGLANLSDGYLEDGLIECPLHQGLFDVKTGEANGAPCVKAVQTFPVQIRGEQILVGIPEGDGE